MAITLNTVVYANDTAESPNKFRYLSPSHTATAKDTLTLSRTDPKPTAESDGKARSEVKRTKLVTLANGKKDVLIVYGGASVPVGTAKADVDALRDDVGDFLIAAVGDNLVVKGTINV